MPDPLKDKKRPARNRIVIYFDKAREMASHSMAHVPGRASRGRKVLIGISIALVALTVGALVGGYFWWQNYKTTPAYSLALLVDAAQRNDTEAFDALVDTDKVTESFVPQVTEKALGRAEALTAPVRGQIAALVPKLIPNMKQRVREEVLRQVKELGARAEGKPFFLIALAMPYVLSIQETDGAAQVQVDGNGRHIELTMTPNEDLWRVVGVKDAALAALIIDNIWKDLPGVAGQVEKEVRKQINKNLPRELPNITLPGGDSGNAENANKNR